MSVKASPSRKHSRATVVRNRKKFSRTTLLGAELPQYTPQVNNLISESKKATDSAAVSNESQDKLDSINLNYEQLLEKDERSPVQKKVCDFTKFYL